MRDDHSSAAPRFTVGGYLRDRWLALVLGVVCAAGLYGMGMTMGVGMQGGIALGAFVLVCLIVALVYGYARRARFWRSVTALRDEAASTCEVLPLLGEPAFLEGQLAYEALERTADLANIELTAAQRASGEYCEYVELWIHEAKTPVAAAKLVLARMSGPEADALARELERVDVQIDQALYYARSTALQKDYAIREVPLAAAAREACKRQARFLIEKQAIPHVEVPDDMTVLSDEPWLVFMLGQVVANAAQYGASSIVFTAREEASGTPHGRTVLEVRDDGCGISAADMPRIFDRGFTGTNGRHSGTATGMGLYLISLMCARLGLGITLASEEGTGTRAIFAFPHNRATLPTPK